MVKGHMEYADIVKWTPLVYRAEAACWICVLFFWLKSHVCVSHCADYRDWSGLL